ncbi:MAG: hypothetical protein WAO19_01715 [Candidatus Kryptoniota bacterium]
MEIGSWKTKYCGENPYAFPPLIFLLVVMSISCSVMVGVNLAHREVVQKTIDPVTHQSA